jgi:hypothetical protein
MKSFFHGSAPAILISALAAVLIFSTPVSAQLLLSQINSPDQLIDGPNADGQIGDYLFANNQIWLIVSNINHTSQYTNTGGHIIDVDLLSGRGDYFSCLFNYFDNSFPNQADYNSAEIVNDGSNGQAAVLRLAGVYSENSQVVVTTDYSLDADVNYIKVQTWLINNSGNPIVDFGLGDAVQWGGTNHFAPGYGFDIANETTTEPWLAATGENVSYGYSIPSGTLTGPNGANWSDPVSFNADIPTGDTATYIRYLAVGTGDIASAVDPIYALRNEPTGILNGQVIDLDSGGGLADATIDVNLFAGEPYTQIRTQQSGDFSANIPQGNYHLIASKSEYSSYELDVFIINGRATTIEIGLTYQGGGGGEYPLADTLSYILRPLQTIPAIVKRDSVFTIEVDADQSASDWQGGLILDDLNFDITIESSVFESDLNLWFIQASMPDSIPIELYDFWITATGLADTVAHAVKIIDNYKPDFYFIQITDTHLPSHIYYDEPGGMEDTSSMADVWSLIKDFEIINPEFVLHTGDLVNEGELEDYLGFRTFSRAKNLLGHLKVPVYLGPGNHDLGGWDETPPPDGTSRHDWWRFFGWSYLDQTSGPGPFTQDYYFDYGNIRFIELEAYINYENWRYQIYGGESFTNLQMAWLADLLGATDPSKSIVTFIHYDFQDELNLSALGIDMNLYGHIHQDAGSIYTQPYNLATNNVCDGERSFRVIYCDSAGLHPQPTFSAGSNGQSFTINYSPGNDGAHDSVTAAITNNYNFTFNHGQVVFNMPHAEAYAVENGVLWQTVEHDSTTKCYVEVSIAANSVTTVSIQVDNSVFLPGDANGDGLLIGSDVTYLVQYFAGRNPSPDPYYAGDANGDCELLGSDVTYLVNYFRNIGPPPVDGNCN